MTNFSLPFEGEYHASPSRRFQEVVVLIHHFGGSKKSTRRHQKMLLQAGFDCVSFNLYFHSHDRTQTIQQRLKSLMFHFLSGKRNFIDQWVIQLSQVLDHLPGEKILYSLSSPSTSAVGVLGPKKRSDIKAWVCDCGPFLDVWTCFWNYSRHEARLSHFWALFLFNLLGFTMFGGWGYERRMKKWMDQIPPQFPALSLRSGQDQLVPPQSIQKFFNLSSNLSLQVCHFDQAGHLDAVKTASKDYQEIVLTFLQKFAKNRLST